MKSGFVSIIGRPNVGKSTLLNAIIGEKVAIIADKPQTTRNRIRGIYNEFNDNSLECQIVFIDTPGITRPKNKLGAYMRDSAVGTFAEVDAIVFVVDEKLGSSGGDMFIRERLESVETPKILAINKMDNMAPDYYEELYKEYEATGVFQEIIGISALNNKNIDVLLKTINKNIGDGPQYFPTDMVTDRPERFLACEIIREKMLHYLHEEVPHGIAVEIESYQEKPNITKISAVIYTEKKTHKGIIIGKDGHTLKGIGKSARQDLEMLFGVKVFLELWVKVKEKWRDSDYILNSLGYGDD